MPIVFEQPQPYDEQVSEDYGALQQYMRGMGSGGRGGGGGGGGGGYQPNYGGGMMAGRSGGDGGDRGPNYEAQVESRLALNEGMLTQAETMRLQRMQQGLSSVQEQLDNGEITEDMAADLAFELKNNMAPLQKRMMESQIAQRESAAEQNTQQAAQIQARMARDAEFQASELEKRVRTITLADGTQASFIIGPDGMPHPVTGQPRGGARAAGGAAAEPAGMDPSRLTTAITTEVDREMANENFRLPTPFANTPEARQEWRRREIIRRARERQDIIQELSQPPGGQQRPGQGTNAPAGEPQGGAALTPEAQEAMVQQNIAAVTSQIDRRAATDGDFSAATYDLRQALESQDMQGIMNAVQSLQPDVTDAIQIPAPLARAIQRYLIAQQTQVNPQQQRPPQAAGASGQAAARPQAPRQMTAAERERHNAVGAQRPMVDRPFYTRRFSEWFQ